MEAACALAGELLNNFLPFSRSYFGKGYNGNITSQTNSAAMGIIGYTGAQYDVTTGLVYDNARYYNPATEQFISQDPIGFSSGTDNLYGYTGDDPVNATDPSGNTIYFPAWRYHTQSDAQKAAGILQSQLQDTIVSALGPQKFGEGDDSLQVRGQLGAPITDNRFQEGENKFWRIVGWQDWTPAERFTGTAFYTKVADVLAGLGQPNPAFKAVTDAGVAENPDSSHIVFVQPGKEGANSIGLYGLATKTVQVDVKPGGVVGALLDASGFAKEAAEFVKEAGKNLSAFWDLIKRLTTKASGHIDQFIGALFSPGPAKIVTNVLKGGIEAFKGFFSTDNLQELLTQGANWLFGQLGDAVKGLGELKLSGPPGIESVAKLLLDALAKLSGADKINLDYLQKVVEDVTGISIDSLKHHFSVFQNLLSSDWPSALYSQLGNVLNGDLFTSLKDKALEVLPEKLLTVAITKVTSALFPAAGLLKQLYDGFTWLIAPSTQKAVEGMVEKLFKVLDTVIKGDPATVGQALLGALNGSLPLILGLTTSVLGVPNVPGTIKTIVDSLDLRHWIQLGVQKAWDAIKEVAGKAFGLAPRRLAGPVSFGTKDPTLTVVQHEDHGMILIDGASLGAVLNNTSLTPTQVGPISALVTKIQETDVKALIQRITASNNARAANKTRGAAKADVIKKADDNVVDAANKANEDLTELGKLLAKVPKLAGGSLAAPPIGPYRGLDFLGRPIGVIATLTKGNLGGGTPAAKSIRPPGFPPKEITDHPYARGHLLGDQLGGSGERDTGRLNLVTLYDNPVNSPNMLLVEYFVKKAVDPKPPGMPQRVVYTVTPRYSGRTPAPTAIAITARGTYPDGAQGIDLNVVIFNRVNSRRIDRITGNGTVEYV